jgi:hypothetical protein
VAEIARFDCVESAPTTGAPDVMKNGVYDLDLSSVMEYGVELPFSADAPESHFRLDVTSDAAGQRAFVSPLFTEPADFELSAIPGAVRLDGFTPIGALGCFTDRIAWNQFVVAVDASGVPSGGVQASGGHYTQSPKSTGTVFISGQGTLEAHTRAPSVRFADPTHDEGSLPWEPIEVVASEPLDPAAFLAALSLTAGSPPAATGDAFTALLDPSGNALGLRRAQTTLGDWSNLVSSLAVNLAPVADSSGNVSAAWSMSPPFIDLGAPSSSFDFSTPMGGTFGGAKWVDATTEPLCDTDGCVETSLFTNGYDAPTGVAGRLAQPLTKVFVRYRLIDPYSATVSDLRLELTTEAGATDTETLPGTTPTPVAGGWATDWIETTIALPASMSGANEIGFAIRPAATAPPSCSINYVPNGAIALVDEISAL